MPSCMLTTVLTVILLQAALPFTFSATQQRATQLFPVFIEDPAARPRYDIIFSREILPESQLEELLAAPATLPEINDAVSSATNTHPSRPLTAAEAGQAYVMQLGRQRHQYFCQLPAIKERKEDDITGAQLLAMESDDTEQTSSEDALEAERVANATRLLAPMKNSDCIYHHQEWWTYEFCYGRTITQYHHPTGKADKVLIYILGEYKYRIPIAQDDEPQDDMSNTRRGNRDGRTILDVSGEKRSLLQHWTGGTICDVTGKPRSVQVQYTCNRNGPDRIAYVEEPGVCRYTIVIHTPRLCDDPSFAAPTRSEADRITCRLVVPDDVYARAKERALKRVQEKEVKQQTSTEEKDQLLDGEEQTEERTKKDTSKEVLDGTASGKEQQKPQKEDDMDLLTQIEKLLEKGQSTSDKKSDTKEKDDDTKKKTLLQDQIAAVLQKEMEKLNAMLNDEDDDEEDEDEEGSTGRKRKSKSDGLLSDLTIYMIDEDGHLKPLSPSKDERPLSEKKEPIQLNDERREVYHKRFLNAYKAEKERKSGVVGRLKSTRSKKNDGMDHEDDDENEANHLRKKLYDFIVQQQEEEEVEHDEL